MATSGTGTGPFTITGTETTLSIYNYVVGQNSANATKNSDNSAFDFNVVLYLGDGIAATVWNSAEEHVRVDASAFQIRANATLNLGLGSPARAGGYWRWNCPDDAFLIAGTLNGRAARLYSNLRVLANTGATIRLTECNAAFLDSIDNNGGNPTIIYERVNFAGANAVAVKLGGTVSLTGCKISGAQFAYQPLSVSGQSPVYTVNDHVGEGNTNDVVPNITPGTNTVQLNIDGAYELTAGVLVPRTGLISSTHNNGHTVRLRWKYNLNSAISGAGASGVNVRIRNVNNATVFSGQTAANGNITQQILPRVELINNATNIPRFPYSVKARRFNLSSEELVWQCDSHTADKFVHTAKDFAPASEAAGLAITGIALVASGANGGTVTLTQPRTATEIWQYFCAWIAQIANQDSNDTWLFDGTTLNLGAWDIAGAGTITGNVTTTGTITAPVTGVKIDANNAGQITITGPAATDTVEMRKASDNSLIATRTGPGAFAVSPANVGVSVYFERKVGAVLVMSTQTTPVTLSTVNEDVPMFAGPQVAVANVDGMAKEATLLTRASQASVDALASTNQTEHDATQAAIAALPAPLSSAQTQAAAAAALVAYDGVVPADLVGLATSANVTAAQSAIIAEVDAIPTNPLLTTDSRLNNLDAAVSSRSTLTAPQVRTELATELGRLDVAVSSRLAASAYTAPTTAPTAADNAAAVRTNLATELARIDVATSTRLAATSYVAPTTAPTAAQNASAVRTELATELARVDATVSSRLASASYTAPPTVAAIRADIERTGGMLDAVPTLAEVEASAVLAKQSGFTGLATAANVTAAQTAIVAEVNANEVKIDAIKAKTDVLTNAPTAAQIRTELEAAGSKLDTASKKSKAAWVNSL